MIGIFCAFMRLMISSLCCGDGGMPGFGSRNPTTSRPNALAKFGHELWYVTILAPLNGASRAAHRASPALSFASKSARFFAYSAAPAGSSAVSFVAIARAITRPFFGSSQ